MDGPRRSRPTVVLANTRAHRWASLLAVVLAAALAGCAGPAAPAGAAVQSLGPGAYLSQGVLQDWGPANHGHVSNQGFIVGERCVAVIDTGGTRGNGLALKAAIARVTALPVCYVINTHAHPDHVLGNEAFLPPPGSAASAPQFVGHRRLPAALAARGPAYLNALARDFGPAEAGTRLVPPTLLVASTLQLDLGGRRLLLRAWPTAHTDADLSVFDEATATLWLGDLLFVQHTPVVDGQLKGWLAVLDELRGWPVDTVVPGHGPPSRDWPAALDAERHYLQQLQADTRAALRQGLTLSQAVQRIQPDSPHWRLLDVFHPRNVTAAYAELEWE